MRPGCGLSIMGMVAGMLGGLLTESAWAQVGLTATDTPYSQAFDTLPASGSATWTNNSTIPGWFHARTGTGSTIVALNGGSNAGNLYSFGTGTSTDRALGSVGSGNLAIGNMFWGVRLQNQTGATINSLDVSYVGEQWRNSGAAAQAIAFSYLVGSSTVTGSLAEFQSTGVPVAALDFTSPITGGTPGALDGNLAANRVSRSASITGLTIPDGSEVMLRWSDPDHPGVNDHGLAIDELLVTPHGDEAPPDTTIDSGPSNPSRSPDASFTFGGADDAGTGVTGFECELDGAGFTACSSPVSYSSLRDGEHIFRVRAIDGAGNVDPTPATFTWTIDTTTPPATPRPATTPGGAVLRLRAPGLSVFGRAGSRARCRMRTGGIRSCKVRLLVGRRVLARGRAAGGRPGSGLTVTVRLTEFGRTLLARRLGGVQARMRARAATSGGARTATARTRAILRVERFTTPAGSWAPGRAGLTESGRSFVHSLRGKLIAVAGLRCDGHDANLRGSAVFSSRLSLARARVMCDALGRLGVRTRPRLVGHGEAQPIASNATAAGRARNRRVEVTLTHRPRRR